ncbi:methylenetetrahydrofolate reductase [Helicobacter turcicus]|uniref:Methylenetetrahydrofolate reductase n=1 Tax=Helicobacter turcicus TaxID=2867412 RepID=A0ABS7JKM7_9HELI|nr:methylenetetrahydrofolate reductase [Helicobacter turcicus]MBX7489942.1 methylenetetrahydrofolate reductase [Helicobacter turcicus]MBX7544801.1 methylenetetrahydrofolate reductase [Helicobacter turcicus]
MQKFDSQKIESFINQLQSGAKCYTYEFSAPASFSLEDLFDRLKNHSFVGELDAFICTDSPLGKLKHSAVLASLKLQNTFGIPSITTIAMRDKNTLALQSELIGMNSLDLRLILALTGDPLRLGNQPQAKGVFEGSSALLLKIIAALNRNKDINGESLQGDSKSIYPFCVLNSYAKNKENLYRKMREKIQNGALAIFTQPIYDIGIAEELLEWCSNINLECNTKCALVFGFFPISSYKTALFLHHKLPGVFVPKDWLEALEVAKNQGSEWEVGLQKSKELFKGLSALQRKFHFMSANKPEVIARILEI